MSGGGHAAISWAGGSDRWVRAHLGNVAVWPVLPAPPWPPPPDPPLPGWEGMRQSVAPASWARDPHLQRDCMKVIDGDLPSGLPRFPQS